MTKWFRVGKIVNTQGIRGELRVISTTDFPEERFCAGAELYIGCPKQNEKIKVVVASHRLHKQFHLLKFEGYSNINEVEKYKGCELYVPEEMLFELGEGEYYYHEIIGCGVFTEEGEYIGKVKEILTPGANDVWVVERQGKKDALIPYIEDVVKQVDVEEKKIIIHVLEGLME